jgi:hypothetical protein
MPPLLVDENFNHRILRGLKRRLPLLDILFVQEADLGQSDDPSVLTWAAIHNRVVLTHDVNTMTRYAYARLEAGQPVPGLVIVPKELAIGSAIEDLVILLTCSSPDEFPNCVIHLPL